MKLIPRSVTSALGLADSPDNPGLFASLLVALNRNRRRPWTTGNRLHRDRYRDGSPEALAAIAHAEMRRHKRRDRPQGMAS
jgi:hypothetical protein